MLRKLHSCWPEIFVRQNKETAKTICGEKKEGDVSIMGRSRAHRTTITHKIFETNSCFHVK